MANLLKIEREKGNEMAVKIENCEKALHIFMETLTKVSKNGIILIEIG